MPQARRAGTAWLPQVRAIDGGRHPVNGHLGLTPQSVNTLGGGGDPGPRCAGDHRSRTPMSPGRPARSSW